MIQRRLEKLEGKGSQKKSNMDMSDIVLHTLHQRHSDKFRNPCRCIACHAAPPKPRRGASTDESINYIINGKTDKTCTKAEYAAFIEKGVLCTCSTCERRELEDLPRLVVTDYDRDINH